ncbi:MAG: hypothetical protein C0463_06175 [Idiomarina sp.]|nr:hypothetical protein [Idiomarina sp.]
MKYAIVASALALGLTTAAPAKADILFGVYGEAQYWFAETTGGYGAGENFSNFNFDDENQLRLSLALHHPVPLLPNIRIETQDLKSQLVTSNGSQGELDLSHDSAILYYTLLDNTLVRLHAGVAAKRFNGYVSDTQGNAWNLNETIPTAYAMVGVGLPFTGLSAHARGHLLAIDSSSIQDVEVALQYRVFDTALLDGSVQLGYRYFNVELDDVAGLYSDVEFKGPFVAFQLHF